MSILDEKKKARLMTLIAALNCEQKEAVFHNQGPLLVIAGAGSGKTQVATLRIARLIAEGVPPSSIIGVTFTNKAAKEMKERVFSLIGAHILITTFHSLGCRILREFAHLIGYPSSFVIYDEDDRGKVIKIVLKKMAESGRELNYRPDDLIRAISQMKNRSASKAPALKEPVLPELEELFLLYQEELKKASALDFDDLQYQARDLLASFPEVREALEARWQHILVDEYQDTNDVQSEITSLLAGSRCNIFAVGDPDQAIYSWRGANLDHILSFQHRFSGAKEVRLEKNYRSTNMILSASNAVIEHNSGRLEKTLWSDRGVGQKLLCHVAKNDRLEAEYVVSGISALAGDMPLSDMAILYRTNAQSRMFEDELIRKKIPYAIWGGLSFYQRREVKDVIAYARIALLPGDIAAFQRIVNAPKRGIGPLSVEKLVQYASNRAIPIMQLVRGLVDSNFDMALYPGLTLSCTAKQKKGFADFCDVVLRLQNEAKSALQLISSAIYDTGYLAALEKEEAPADFVDRRENLEQLVCRALEWDQEPPEPESLEPMPLSKFFEMMSLETSVQESSSDEARVTLATVHNAKGLEFRTVFLVGLEEDLFPHINIKYKKEGANPLDVDEERRLMYVGMTRAKDLLSLSLAQSRMLWGGFRSMRPSRFLYEIPQECLRKVAFFPMDARGTDGSN